MGLFDFFKTEKTNTSVSEHSEEVLELAKKIAEKRQVIIDLAEQTENLTKKDIGSWHKAWQAAIRHDEPRRKELYEVYSTALIDAHLTGCITQRKGRTLQKDFVIVDKDGNENADARKYFNGEWFIQFLDLALDARYWGNSLIQLGDVIGRNSASMRFENCTLVPRKHVVQEYGVIIKEVYGEIKRGTPYREGELADWCVEVGTPYDLGLLLKVAPHCISKKNMIAYWDTFGELFGMPMRMAFTPSQNQSDWVKIFSQLNKLGAGGTGLFPEGTTIDVKETSRGDSYNVYDKRVDRANSEISKAILGQTMTIDSGSSLSQSETHLEVFNNICKSDATAIKHTINNRLLPLMEKHGFPLAGCTFQWDDAMSYTVAEQRENERLMLQYYEIDPKYFIDKYKIDIVGTKQPNENNFFE